MNGFGFRFGFAVASGAATAGGRCRGSLAGPDPGPSSER